MWRLQLFLILSTCFLIPYEAKPTHFSHSSTRHGHGHSHSHMGRLAARDLADLLVASTHARGMKLTTEQESTIKDLRGLATTELQDGALLLQMGMDVLVNALIGKDADASCDRVVKDIQRSTDKNSVSLSIKSFLALCTFNNIECSPKQVVNIIKDTTSSKHRHSSILGSRNTRAALEQAAKTSNINGDRESIVNFLQARSLPELSAILSTLLQVCGADSLETSKIVGNLVEMGPKDGSITDLQVNGFSTLINSLMDSLTNIANGNKSGFCAATPDSWIVRLLDMGVAKVVIMGLMTALDRSLPPTHNSLMQKGNAMANLVDADVPLTKGAPTSKRAVGQLTNIANLAGNTISTGPKNIIDGNNNVVDTLVGLDVPVAADVAALTNNVGSVGGASGSVANRGGNVINNGPKNIIDGHNNVVQTLVGVDAPVAAGVSALTNNIGSVGGAASPGSGSVGNLGGNVINNGPKNIIDGHNNVVQTLVGLDAPVAADVAALTNNVGSVGGAGSSVKSKHGSGSVANLAGNTINRGPKNIIDGNNNVVQTLVGLDAPVAADVDALTNTFGSVSGSNEIDIPVGVPRSQSVSGSNEIVNPVGVARSQSIANRGGNAINLGPKNIIKGHGNTVLKGVDADIPVALGVAALNQVTGVVNGGSGSPSAGGPLDGVTGGLVNGVTKGVAGGLVDGVTGGVVGGVLNGATGGLVNGVTGGIVKGVTGGLVNGVVDGVAGGLVKGVTGGLVNGVVGGVAGGLVKGVTGGLVNGVVDGVAGGLVKGVTGGVVNGVVGGVAGGLVKGVTGGVVGGLVDGVTGGLLNGATGGLVGGVTDGVLGGATGNLLGGGTGGSAGSHSQSIANKGGNAINVGPKNILKGHGNTVISAVDADIPAAVGVGLLNTVTGVVTGNSGQSGSSGAGGILGGITGAGSSNIANSLGNEINVGPKNILKGHGNTVISAVDADIPAAVGANLLNTVTGVVTGGSKGSHSSSGSGSAGGIANVAGNVINQGPKNIIKGHRNTVIKGVDADIPLAVGVGLLNTVTGVVTGGSKGSHGSSGSGSGTGSIGGIANLGGNVINQGPKNILKGHGNTVISGVDADIPAAVGVNLLNTVTGVVTGNSGQSGAGGLLGGITGAGSPNIANSLGNEINVGPKNIVSGNNNNVLSLVDAVVPVGLGVGVLNNVVGTVTGGGAPAAHDVIQVVDKEGNLLMKIKDENNSGSIGNDLSQTINRGPKKIVMGDDNTILKLVNLDVSALANINLANAIRGSSGACNGIANKLGNEINTGPENVIEGDRNTVVTLLNLNLNAIASISALNTIIGAVGNDCQEPTTPSPPTPSPPTPSPPTPSPPTPSPPTPEPPTEEPPTPEPPTPSPPTPTPPTPSPPTPPPSTPNPNLCYRRYCRKWRTRPSYLCYKNCGGSFVYKP